MPLSSDPEEPDAAVAVESCLRKEAPEFAPQEAAGPARPEERARPAGPGGREGVA